MYCIKCGVKLTEGKKPCPLCGTVPFHPDVVAEESESLYPAGRYPSNTQVSPTVVLIIVTALLFFLPIVITLQCDLLINGTVSWSGYVIGALLMIYVPVVLPLWFRKKNPVIFIPCSFAAIALYLLYINFAVGGSWFLSFAFPVVGFAALNVTAVAALMRYVPRGNLYTIGGSLVLTGLFMPVMELLINITFHKPSFVAWSVYPLTALVLLGGLLIFLAIYPPAREMMERKFFL